MTRRWPTAVGLVLGGCLVAVVLLQDEPDFAPPIAGMAGIYLAAYALDRPAAAWVAFPALSAVMVLLEALDLDAATGMTTVAVLLWVWAAAAGGTADRRLFTLQTAGLVAFCVVTMLAALAQPRLGIALAGVGFVAHGLWDAYHFRIDRVVHRSWSEACLVVDLPVGVALVAVAMVG